MNFIEYDPNTGKSVCFGNMNRSTLNEIIEEGRPYIIIENWPPDFDLRLYDVDLKTLTLVRNSEPVELPPPAIPPEMLFANDRQFYQQAAIENYITNEDALKAVQSGFIPPIFQQIVDSIEDPNEKFKYQLYFGGTTAILRTDPIVEDIRKSFGKTSKQMDKFFLDAMKL